MDQNKPTTQATEPTEQAPPVVQAETLEPAPEQPLTTETAATPTDPNADTAILPALVDDPAAEISPATETVSPSSLEQLTEARDESPADEGPARVQVVSLSIDSNAAELGLPAGTIMRSTSLLISADDPPGYTPTDLHVALTPKAQLGLRRLAAGRAAYLQGEVDHIATVRELLESFAD